MSGSVNNKAADLSAKYREAKDAVMMLLQRCQTTGRVTRSRWTRRKSPDDGTTGNAPVPG